MITDQQSEVQFSGTGSTGPFPFTFPVIPDSTALVVEVTAPSGATTVLTIITDYTVTPVNGDYMNGGNVTLTSALLSGYTLTIYRNTPETQVKQFTDGMSSLYSEFEDGLDKLTLMIQDFIYKTTGAVGPIGPQGIPGTNGHTVLAGSGIPSSSIGNAGDFYMDTTAWAIYGPKTTLWGSGTPLAGGSVATPANISNQLNTATGYFQPPVGTTAQRPGSPASGMIRTNSTTGRLEWYNGLSSAWEGIATAYSINYLIVGGGGGGGGAYNGTAAGGGGGGAVVFGSINIASGTSLQVVVGAGGVGGIGNSTITGSNGGTSSLTLIPVAFGGGGGGGGNGTGTLTNGTDGSSGGGGAGDNGENSLAGSATQGYHGGAGAFYVSNYSSGGGGGAGAVGTAGNSGASGNGGIGVSNAISGANVYYGGGGGGTGSNGVAGSGGSGGGGNGSAGTGNGTAGTANTGGGGGGSFTGSSSTQTGGTGGTGIVIISYLGSQRATGGTVTTSGSYTIHTFTSSGTFVS